MSIYYLLGIDQSTQGTKVLLMDQEGNIRKRTDRSHRQIVNEKGWISHDPIEIYRNTLAAVRQCLEETGVDRHLIAGVGLSNQRETALVWDRKDGRPLGLAVVWQCARAADICERIENQGLADTIRTVTGIPLSPYFPAAKIAWLLGQEGVEEKRKEKRLCCGTIDSWMIYCLTGGKEYKTDYSNASRTQLFDIFKLRWSEELCGYFGLCPEELPEICGSDSRFGETDFEGLLPKPVPIHGVMGDSHGALFGQGCLEKGMIKATYGTGSSIMMNIGETPVLSEHGVVTSLAWKIGGRVHYVLEGNLNYTGAVISWLKEDMKLISSPAETSELAREAWPEDQTYLVPAFSGLGAPYWRSRARAAIIGMSRTTGRKEIVKAGVECIAYQIADVVKAMSRDAGLKVKDLRVDGGPTRNSYLMQFQSDILQAEVGVPEAEELSAIGPLYAAGLALGMWDGSIFNKLERRQFRPCMSAKEAEKKYAGWKTAVGKVL